MTAYSRGADFERRVQTQLQREGGEAVTAVIRVGARREFLPYSAFAGGIGAGLFLRPHRAAAAFRAIRRRSSAVSLVSRAFPPLRPRATACGFLRLVMYAEYAKRLGGVN
jgi:hypothetical protein